MAAASVHVMQLPQALYAQHTQPMQSHINVGFGSDVTIRELALAVGHAVGYLGAIIFDATKPDGAPRKWMDSTKISTLGWKPLVDLEVGLHKSYIEFQQLEVN